MVSSHVVDHRKHFGVFRPFIGATLQTMVFAKYHFNGEPSGNDIGALELGFDSNAYFLLSLASDGETVTASNDRLRVQPGFNLEDGSRCDWVRTECENEFIGQRLVAVDAQIDRIGNSGRFTSGWILRFNSGFFGYHNFGDDAYLLYNQSAPGYESVTTTFECVAGPIVG